MTKGGGLCKKTKGEVVTEREVVTHRGGLDQKVDLYKMTRKMVFTKDHREVLTKGWSRLNDKRGEVAAKQQKRGGRS